MLQSVAESYLRQLPQFGGSRSIREVLAAGSNNLDFVEGTADTPVLDGATRLTQAQIDYFTTNYAIVAHYPVAVEALGVEPEEPVSGDEAPLQPEA